MQELAADWTLPCVVVGLIKGWHGGLDSLKLSEEDFGDSRRRVALNHARACSGTARCRLIAVNEDVAHQRAKVSNARLRPGQATHGPITDSRNERLHVNWVT